MAIHIGDLGRALSDMSPSGFVEVGGKRIDARSEGQVIEAGSTVVVIRGDPTGFVVRKVEPGQAPPQLPNHGTPIRRADFQRNSAEVAEADEKARIEARAQLIRRFGSVSLGAGMLGGLVGFLWQFESRDAATIALWTVGGAILFAAVACVAVWILGNVIGSGGGE